MSSDITLEWMKEGNFTYGQRIELGRLLSQVKDDNQMEIAFKIFESIKGKSPSLKEMMNFAEKEFNNVVEGIAYWIDIENQLLHYDPTPEEVAAGINTMQTSQMGTVYKLARDFGCLPNVILELPYNEVFGILWSDKENADFERKLNKIYSKKKK